MDDEARRILEMIMLIFYWVALIIKHAIFRH